MGLLQGSLFCPLIKCLFFVLVGCCFDYCSFVYSCLKSESVYLGFQPCALSFVLRIALEILSLMWFIVNFKVIVTSSAKTVTGVLIWITLNLQIALSSMAILTVLILPVQEHVISFHFFELSLVSFSSVLQSSAYKFFSNSDKFIPGLYLGEGGCNFKQDCFLLFLIVHCQCK